MTCLFEPFELVLCFPDELWLVDRKGEQFREEHLTPTLLPYCSDTSLHPIIRTATSIHLYIITPICSVFLWSNHKWALVTLKITCASMNKIKMWTMFESEKIQKMGWTFNPSPVWFKRADSASIRNSFQTTDSYLTPFNPGWLRKKYHKCYVSDTKVSSQERG